MYWLQYGYYSTTLYEVVKMIDWLIDIRLLKIDRLQF